MNFTEQFTEYKFPLFENGVRLPEIKIPVEEKTKLGLKETASNEEYLKKKTWANCLAKIDSGKIKQDKKICIDRLKTEFEVFKKTNTVDYILLLMDIFLWCDNNNIPRGSGRGSAAGSLALYVLDLTSVNPLDHNLNFTRFLNEARAKTHLIDGITYVDGKSFADFDGDISFARRPDVIRRIEKDYPNKTCKILTLQYLTGKMALKDTVKSYLEYNETQALELGNEVESLFGKVDSISKTYEKSKKFKEWADNNKASYDIIRKIEGLLRGSGQHASGVLVNYHNLDETVPMETASSGEIVSGFDMDIALTISLKADLLGLRTLDVLQICSESTGVNYKDIDFNSKEAYDFYQYSDKFYGLFQIEDGLTKEVVKKIKPKNIDQLAACLSISRPGALAGIGKFEKYVKTGEREKIYLQIDDILEQTGGLILYQEQINTICQQVYKMDAISSDEVRRAIGKKNKDDMAKWEPVLCKNGKEQNIPESITKWFWDTCNASADYLFNANHCYSYAYITVYTTYFKAKYPLQFFLACLIMSRHESDPTQCITSIQNELGTFNIKLLPLDIIKSKDEYSIEGNDIRMGLNGLKGLSEKGLEKLHNFKASSANKFQLFQNLISSKIPLNVCMALILSGAFDSISCGAKRSKLLLELQVFKLLTAKELNFVISIGEQYNYDLLLIVKNMAETLKNEKGKPIIKDSRFNTIKRDYDPYKQIFLANSKHEKLSAYFFETTYLGFSYTTTLKKIYSEKCVDLSALNEIVQDDVVDVPFRAAVQVLELENRVSKKGKKYVSLLVKDDTGTQKMMLMGEDRIEATRQVNSRDVKEGDILIVNGKRLKKSDAFFLDSILIQINPVVIRKSELAEKELAQL